MIAPPVSAQKPPTGFSLVIFMPMVLTMRQPPNSVPRAIARGRRAPPRAAADPWPPRCPAAMQQHPDDAHGLLRVVAAVAEAVERRRDELQPPEPAVDAAAASSARRARTPRSSAATPSTKPSSGESTMAAAVLRKPAAIERADAALGDRRAGQPADQRVRGARRNAVVPGDQVPGDRADQRAEDHVVIDDGRIDDALADRRGDADAEDEERDEVEERRPERPPSAASARASRRRSRSSWRRRGSRS